MAQVIISQSGPLSIVELNNAGQAKVLLGENTAQAAAQALKAAGQAVLAGHYANDATDTDVPGGAAGERGAKYWALMASTALTSLNGTYNGTIGRPIAPVSGAAATANAILFYDSPPVAASITSIVIVPRQAGAIPLNIYSFSGSTNTKVRSFSATITSDEVGQRVSLTPARFGQTTLALAANERVQLGTGGIIDTTSNTADGGGIYGGSLGASSITVNSWTTSTRAEVQINYSYQQQVVTGPAFQALQSAVASNTASIASVTAIANATAGQVSSLNGTFAGTIGRPVAPVSGAAATANAILFRDNPSSAASIASIVFVPRQAGNITLNIYSFSGSTNTLARSFTATVAIGEAGQQVSLTPSRFGQASLPLAANERVQLSTGGMVDTTANAADGGGLYGGSLGASSITVSAWLTSVRAEVQINYSYQAQAVTGPLFQALQTSVAANIAAIAAVTATANQALALAQTGSPEALAVLGMDTSAVTQLTFGVSTPNTQNSSGAIGGPNKPTTVRGVPKRVNLKFAGAGNTGMLVFPVPDGQGGFSGKAFGPFTVGGDVELAAGIHYPVFILPIGSFVCWAPLSGVNVRSTATGATVGARTWRDWSGVSGDPITSSAEFPGTDVALAMTIVATPDNLSDKIASNAAAISSLALASNRITIETGAAWNHIQGYGQSQDAAQDATALLTDPQSVRHYTFGLGLRVLSPTAAITQSGYVNGDGTVKKLVEAVQDGCGQTKCTPFAKEITRRLAKKISYTLPVWFCSVAGRPGTAMSGIGAASAWYTASMVYQMTAANTYCQANGLVYNCAAVAMDHGATDNLNGTSQANYYAGLTGLIDNHRSRYQKLTGRTNVPVWLFTIPTYYAPKSTGPAEAILQVCAERLYCWMVSPEYRFPHINNLHLTAMGQALKGAYLSRAVEYLARGRAVPCFRWGAATYIGSTVTVWANTPTQPGICTTDPWVTACTDYGVAVQDDSGQLTLSGIAWGTSIKRDDDGTYDTPLTITVNRALAANPVFRNAKDYLGAGMLIDHGASSQLYAPVTESYTIPGTSTTYLMHHFAPPITMTIQVGE